MTELKYDAFELVERAIRNAKPRIGSDAPRWVAVKYAFGVGSTLAHELCRAYGFDPDEIVISPKCEACDAEADDVEQNSEEGKGLVMRVSFKVPAEDVRVEYLFDGKSSTRPVAFGEVFSQLGFVPTGDDSNSVVYLPE